MPLFRSRSAMKSVRSLLLVAAVVASAAAASGQSNCTSNPVSTFTAANGVWTLSPGVNQYQSVVSGPIAADGSSTYPAKRGTIPVQFSLSEGTAPTVFQSIGSDGYHLFNLDPAPPATPIYSNDCSYLDYAPNTNMTIDQLTNLSAVYAFTVGNCHGGSLRWSIIFKNGTHMYIYYGNDSGSWTDCSSSGTATNQSGLTNNMIGATFDDAAGDTRYETSASGGSYVNWTTAKAWAEAQGAIASVTLVLDSGWQQDCGQTVCDQKLNLGQVMVNGDTFTPPTPVAIGSTCALPAAQIQVTKTSGVDQGVVNQVLSVSSADTTGSFRMVDCHYMYNLDVSSLSGAGTYTVSPLINGAVAGTATFTLK